MTRLRGKVLRTVPPRAKLLAKWAKENQWTIGAELGVLDGRTFLHLLSQCPQLSMVGVDIWKVRPEMDALHNAGGRSYSGFDMEGAYTTLMAKLAPYGPRACVMRMNTADAAIFYQDGAFDFVFVDADHTYDGVSADLQAWLPKIRPGGWMIGHDWDVDQFPGVVEAVTEKFGVPRTYEDHVWAVTV